MTRRGAAGLPGPTGSLLDPLVVLPVVVVAVSTVFVAVRWPDLVVLLAGTAVLRQRGAVTAWIWAALIPLELRLAYASATPVLTPSLADCGSLLSPTATARALEAVVVIGALAAVAWWMGADRASLSLRLPDHAVTALAVAAPIVVAPAALLVGPLLAEPFFGQIRIDVGVASAIVPALGLGLSNGLLEELVFRGAILGWGARVIGARPAVALQAILFGLAHVGPDFLNPLAALPVLLAVAAGGVVAGLIVRRTGSLLLPVAIHVALDIPIYYALACRLPG
jgi:membrane protease YdiL (CAAX protease family)